MSDGIITLEPRFGYIETLAKNFACLASIYGYFLFVRRFLC